MCSLSDDIVNNAFYSAYSIINNIRTTAYSVLDTIANTAHKRVAVITSACYLILEVVVEVTPEDVEPELSSFLEQPASITPQRPRQVSIANIFFIIKFLSV